MSMIHFSQSIWHFICKVCFARTVYAVFGRINESIIMKLAGIVLIIIGVLALVYQGFSYTKTEKDAQLGPIEIQHQETQTVPLPPIVGGVCIGGGALALALGARGKV